MNIIQKTRLQLMTNNLKELYRIRENTPKDSISKVDVKIKMKLESINIYKKEIGL